ncbi:unnamed protein product [Cuscuta campestris]|uniref:Uncharacterized protein n=1 Tax=Cuscuta campestris TaxID=132261 RepID=A0A484MJ47_9ASTE|nr:unnamed protein product [Cuscuta campestris]
MQGTEAATLHFRFWVANAIPGGVGSWALDPFGPGERVTLGRGLVNQLVAPLVEGRAIFFNLKLIFFLRKFASVPVGATAEKYYWTSILDMFWAQQTTA